VEPRPSGIEFRVLGPVEAWRNGERLALGGPRQQALLAMLLLEAPRPVSIDRLVSELWADEPPDGADVTIRSYVSRLRSSLGDGVAISAVAAGYALDVAPDAIDARRFERLIATDASRPAGGADRRRSRDRLAAALELWVGTPFAQLPQIGALRIEAERLAELRLQALGRRIDADLEMGLSDALVPELEGLLRDHPFRERFWAQLMLALYRANRQADALAAYHRARTALDEHLGIEPGDELVSLQAAILRHEVPEVAPPTQRHNLPAPIATFVGREAELLRVQGLVRSNRLVTLTGVGGVGKTRLAVEAARGMVTWFADGVAFIDLAPLGDPALLADHLVAVLDPGGPSNVDPIERVAGHLREQERLVVLDNCEHLLAACAAVTSRLLTTCPFIRILATSRELLGVDGEVDAEVNPLGVPAKGDPDIRESEAVRLFMARARAARPGLADDDQTIAAVGRICADLEGIPLAIELAAARARVLSPAEINDRLRDRFRFLVSWRRLGTARHRTLREAMDWSHDLLDPAGQRLLAELSVFTGGFGLDAVQAVCAIDSADDALDQVQRLVEASLVNVEQAGGPTRYTLLETVRQYGADRLEASGRSEDLRRRHAEHFAAVADDGWLQLHIPATQAFWLERLRVDRDNYRAALGWSLDRGESQIALRIAGTLWRYWWIWGEPQEGRAWLERALAADDRSNPERRGRCLIGLAGLLWSLGDHEAAAGPADEARRLADEVGDNVVAAAASNTLGLIVSGQGDGLRARGFFEESVARYRVADLPPDVRDWNLAIAIDNVGSAAHSLGDDEAALRNWREARAINERLGSDEGIAMNDLHLSILEAEGRRPDDARIRLLRSLTHYESLSFRHYLSECFEVAALVANGLGAHADAAFALGAAARIHAELRNQPVPFMDLLRHRETAAARSALGDDAFDALYADGLAAPVAEAVRRTKERFGASPTATGLQPSRSTLGA
jgi:predicted ATPase/DNA-binding SARP family transcriptional activator